MNIVVNPLKLKFFLCQDLLHSMPGLLSHMDKTFCIPYQDFVHPLPGLLRPLYIRLDFKKLKFCRFLAKNFAEKIEKMTISWLSQHFQNFSMRAIDFSHKIIPNRSLFEEKNFRKFFRQKTAKFRFFKAHPVRCF